MTGFQKIGKQAEAAAFWSIVAFAVLGPIGMALQETTVVLGILSWLIASVVFRRPLLNASHAPLILWFLAACLSLVNASDLATGLKGLQKMLKVIGFFLAVSATVRASKRWKTVLTAITIGAAIVSFDGLWQVATGADLFYGKPPGGGPGGLARLMATFGHPNDYGSYAVSVLPVCLVMALPPLVRKPAFGYWFAVVLLGAALPMTFSRPAVLAVTVSATLFLALRKAWKSLGVFLASGMVAVVLLPSAVKVWVAEQPSWLHVVAQPLRFEIWQAGWAMIKAHPFLGIGANLFVRDYARYRIAGDSLTAAYAHNHFLQMAAEIGVLGLAAFLWFLAVSFAAWKRLLQSSRLEMRHAAIGLGCGVVAFLAIGLLESALQSSRCNAVFWLLMGLLHGLAKSGIDKGSRYPV